MTSCASAGRVAWPVKTPMSPRLALRPLSKTTFSSSEGTCRGSRTERSCISHYRGERRSGTRPAQRLVAEGGRVAVCGRDEERLSHAQGLLGNEALCIAPT